MEKLKKLISKYKELEDKMIELEKKLTYKIRNEETGDITITFDRDHVKIKQEFEGSEDVIIIPYSKLDKFKRIINKF